MPRKNVLGKIEIPHYSVLATNGRFDSRLAPKVSKTDLRKLYKAMVASREFDELRLRLQRQGRIGTFAPSMGQEAAQLGSVYCIKPTDWLVPSFRETAALLWRGMKPETDLLYAAGYEEALQYDDDSRDLPIAIPVASQLPHAAGLAWAMKLQKRKEIVLTYFGDGATSEGDFHEAMNFATVYGLPLVFFCQNNQYAISVPREKQTAAKTLAQKAIAYEMPAVQVDGNDLFAVVRATKEAVDRARRGRGPTMIEAVTYRMNVHTTADDPTKYRSAREVKRWRRKDPIDRLRKHLLKKKVIKKEDDERWREAIKRELKEAVQRFEKMTDAKPGDMFKHAWASEPPHLARQREEVEEWFAKHPPEGS